MDSELNTKVIDAVKEFKAVLCDQCSNKVTPNQKVVFADAVLVRSIREIEQMLDREISPDVRSALEWVTYKREII